MKQPNETKIENAAALAALLLAIGIPILAIFNALNNATALLLISGIVILFIWAWRS